MLNSKFLTGKNFIVTLAAAVILQSQAVGEKATGEDFFFPHEEMEFSGIAFDPKGFPLSVDENIDVRFEQARCGLAIHRPEKGLSEWMFAIYEVIRQGHHNVRLAALPSMLTKGILINAAEELESGNLEYSDKRRNPARPVRLFYGSIQENLIQQVAKKLRGAVPDPEKFRGSDYFISFVLPHWKKGDWQSWRQWDVTFVVYFQQGVIQGFEYRLVTRLRNSVDLKKMPILRKSRPKKVGDQKYFTYMICK